MPELDLENLDKVSSLEAKHSLDNGNGTTNASRSPAGDIQIKISSTDDSDIIVDTDKASMEIEVLAENDASSSSPLFLSKPGFFRKISCVEGGGDPEETFFERFSSIRIQYEKSERKTIEEFQFTQDVVDGTIADQMWHTLGGWNIDELYSEVLSAVIHIIGPSSEKSNQSNCLTSHLQQVFRIDSAKHDKILQTAREKQPPSHVLNLEVVEAKGLKGKDINGQSDPFCTLYTSSWEKHNTSIKPATLNPVWREYFSLPLTNGQDEVLNIEVLDYDPEETLSDKMRRFSEVKSTRGLRILMKEIALTASTGKHTQEFLGCLKIPLKSIPPEGFDKWFTLEGKNGNGHKKKGEIHLRMALGAEKEKKVALQEFRHVMHLLLVYELDLGNIEPYVWEGGFTKHSETILYQLQWQGGLTPKDIELAKWLVFTRVHSDHPFNTRIFHPIFDSIKHCLDDQSISDDEKKRFWFLTEKLIENFTNFFKNIRSSTLNNSTSQVYHMIKTLGSIRSHLEEKSVKSEAGGSRITSDLIIEKIENAISRGGHELFMGIYNQNGYNSNNDSGIGCELDPIELEIEKMVKLGQLLIADMRKGLELHQPVFKELIGIDYFDVTYRVFDEKYGEAVEKLVESVNRKLKPIHLRDDDVQEKEVTIGTNLFELYLAVKQFSDLSSNLTTGLNDLTIHGAFHNWFHPSVAQWLDIALYKAMKRINKAVQLDNLNPLDEIVQITSSAVDTAHIFHQIQIFWSQLSWPEAEGAKTFITKILDDLCRCTIYYSETMCSKVSEIELKYGDIRYEISDEVCLAINNIEHIGMEMMPISQKLGSEEILKELAEIKGQAISDQCRSTLTAVMENANESINNKIYDILDKIGAKIKPMIERLLLEGSENDNDEDGVEKLIKYLDKNLIKLKNKVSNQSFLKMLDIIWEYTSASIEDLIRTNIEKRRPPTFFKQVYRMLQILINFFYPDGLPDTLEQSSNIQGIKSLIELHGSPTYELIQRYLQARYTEQVGIKSKVGELGQVTIRTLYAEDIHTLKIEILNARNLKSHDSNGFCDPYLKLKLYPESLFPHCQNFKTKVKKRTLFPLFDEIFSIPIKPEEMNLGGFVVMSVKDHDLFGRNDHMGDALIPLDSVPFINSGTKIRDLPQIYINLTKPLLLSSPILHILEGRQNWDKIACDFAKKERHKISSISQQEEV